VEEFLNSHSADEICLIQNDYDDPFNTARADFYGVGAWPTVVSNGVTDAWPLECLEGDFQANVAIPSPLTIAIVENGVGDFTAQITAEQDVVDAHFFMVATLAEDVPSSSGTSFLPRHVKLHLTPPATGDPFTLYAGQSIEIHHTFAVQPGWDYALMGVAAWVSRPGGTTVSPCTGGFPLTMNQVLQSRWVPTTSGTSGVETQALGMMPALHVVPNPGIGTRTISYVLPHQGRAQLGIYDAQGRLLEQLDVRNEAGRHAIDWTPSDRSTAHGGVWFVRLDFDGQTVTRELLVIR